MSEMELQTNVRRMLKNNTYEVSSVVDDMNNHLNSYRI